MGNVGGIGGIGVVGAVAASNYKAANFNILIEQEELGIRGGAAYKNRKRRGVFKLQTLSCPKRDSSGRVCTIGSVIIFPNRSRKSVPGGENSCKAGEGSNQFE